MVLSGISFFSLWWAWLYPSGIIVPSENSGHQGDSGKSVIMYREARNAWEQLKAFKELNLKISKDFLQRRRRS